MKRPAFAALPLCLAALLSGPVGSSAQTSGSFNRTGSGARAAGMGNAFVAVSDDGTAATWNPAGLAQLRKPELAFVYSAFGRSAALEGYRTLDDRFTFTPRRGGEASQFIDFASLAIPLTILRPVTFQVGWRRLYSLDTGLGGSFLREPTGLAPEGPVTGFATRLDGDGSVDIVSLAAAMRVTRRLSLGLSVNLWDGGWEFRESTRQRVEGEPADFLDFGQRQGAKGTNLNFGMMLHLPSWRAGVVYHAPMDAAFRSTSTLDSTLPPPGLELEATLPEEARMRFPTSLGMGASWKPEPRWTVALDATWDEWREWTIDGPGLEAPVNFSDGETVDRTSTRNTISFNAGAEWILQRPGFLVPFRFGLAHEPQGPRDPVLFTGYALELITVGVGYNTNRFKLDVALQRGWFDVRQTDSISIESELRSALAEEPLPDSVGLRQERFWRLKVSAILRIVDTEGLQRTLGRIFGGS